MKRDIRNELIKETRTMVGIITEDKELREEYNKQCIAHNVNITKVDEVPRWCVLDSIRSSELVELAKICVAILKVRVA